MPRFMFAGDALLHPAYDETAGMVIIEAMLAGLPVLTTRNCGYARYISEQEAGIVEGLPFSQESLNASLVRILESDEREAWVANALRAGQREELFQLVPKLADLVEQFGQQRKPLLVFCLFRYFPYGGLQRDFLKIAERCQAAGYAIHVFALEWFGDVPEGFTVEIVEADHTLNHNRYAHFADYVTEHARWLRPELIIGFNKIPGLDVYYAADPCYEYKARELRTWAYRSTRRYRRMAAFERAVFAPSANTQVLLLTETQQEQFVSTYGTQPDRLHILPPGVSQGRARGDAADEQRTRIRTELGLAEDNLLLLQVGSGFITKGLDRVMHMLAALPQDLRARVQLLVIGQDNPTAFLKLAKKLNIAEQISIQRGRDDIPAVLQAADLMVHPAYMESGGLVLIEAVIAGLPVIASFRNAVGLS